jgi:hypothetical protein
MILLCPVIVEARGQEVQTFEALASLSSDGDLRFFGLSRNKRWEELTIPVTIKGFRNLDEKKMFEDQIAPVLNFKFFDPVI